MDYTINKAAVLGAGVMGQGIAAHLANAGIPSLLYDMVPAEGSRSELAVRGIENAKKLKPAAFYHKDFASRITPANYEDDADKLRECDLIIEVVVERLDIKRKVFSWVAEHRREGSIVASNTSGLSLDDMGAEMPGEMRSHFLITHFFNPVRYMRLLELVSSDATLPEVTQAITDFGSKVLGKGIVAAKDTPNFIANRIGTYGICSIFRHLDRLEMSVDEVDAIFGPAMGRPKSAVFRTADLVGLDTLDHVLRTVYEGCPDDEEREVFQSPSWLKVMLEEGALGAKSGAGFYKKVKGEGGSQILSRDLKTGEYQEKQKVRFDSIGRARKADGSAEAIAALISGDDKAAELAWAATADVLIYAANRIPEIADDVVNVDRALRWGFAWDLGPFETWDALGVAETVSRMQEEGRAVPAWVTDMLASGRTHFYTRDDQDTQSQAVPGGTRAVATSKRWLSIADAKRRGGLVEKGLGASLVDLGQGVLCLEFHAKMNAIDNETVEFYEKALDRLDAGEFEALVVGNQGGSAFCAGANLFLVAMAAMQGEWGQLGDLVSRLQKVCRRARYSPHPVVTAPWGLTLGGGAEVAMQCSATRASGELYMGLVEVGVGVIPGGGGCAEMLQRYLGDIPPTCDFDPNPLVQQAYKNIALAQVATSAEEARAMRYLRPGDTLCLDPDALIHEARRLARSLVDGGYTPPVKRAVKLPGNSGRAAIEVFLYQMKEGGYATDHDVVVGKQLARVMTGGDVPNNTWVEEETILELEREAFLSLCGEAKTLERIQHMLNTGKPLRN